MFKKKKYLYNVAYLFQGGYGCAQIIRDTKVNTIEKFNSLKQFIETNNKLSNVVIINLQLLGKIKTEI